METFFEPQNRLRLWPHEAAATQIAASSAWPPTLAAIGCAPCIRAWQPTGQVPATQFEPVSVTREVDGMHFAFCLLQVDGVATSMAALDGFLAVGTSKGCVRVWRRTEDMQFELLFTPDLQLDKHPIYALQLGNDAQDNGPVLVVHSAGHHRVGVWRLSDGKMVHVWGLLPEAFAQLGAEQVMVLANVRHACLAEGMLARVGWLEGEAPVVHLMNVSDGGGGVVDAADRLLASHGEPLAADFDGALLVIGFSSGAVCAFGYRGWTRWHHGAVAAAKCMPTRQQVVTGGADQRLKLWDVEGQVLMSLDLQFQVTCMALTSVAIAVGGSDGQIELVLLTADANPRPHDEQATQLAMQPCSGTCPQYNLYFDGRGKEGGKASCSSEDPEGLSHFVRRRKIVQPANRPPQSAAQPAVDADTAGEATTASVGVPERSSSDNKQDLAARQAMQRQMGEGEGVARMAAVALPSDTALMGRKCDNASCCMRQGVGKTVLMRCGGCRQRWYCGQHCQRTHWRDGHGKECAQLKLNMGAPAG